MPTNRTAAQIQAELDADPSFRQAVTLSRQNPRRGDLQRWMTAHPALMAEIRGLPRAPGVDGHDPDGGWGITFGTGRVQQAPDTDWKNFGIKAGVTIGAMATGVGALNAIPAAVAAPTLGGAYGAVPPVITSQAVSTIAPTVAGAGGALNTIRRAAGSFSARDWLDLVTTGVQTGVNMWSANRSADASAEAARIEAESYQKGLDFLKEQWAKYNTDFEPYLRAGQGAITRMSGALEGTSAPAMPASVAARLNGTPALGTYGQPQPRPTTPTAPQPRPTIERPPNAPPVSTTMPVPSPAGPPLRDPGEPDSLGNFGQPPVSTTMPVGVGGNQGQIGHITKGGTVPLQLVRIQAPDGEIRELPEQMANAYLARGARRIA